MVSRSQRLCRLCEFPATDDGGVPLDALDADKLAAWWRCTLDAEFKIETGAEQLRTLICQFCICEARFVHEHSQDNCSCSKKTGCDWWAGHGDDLFYQHYCYQKPLIQPCKVVLEQISSDCDHHEYTNITVNAIHHSNAHVQNNLEGLNSPKVECQPSLIEANNAINLFSCTMCHETMNSQCGLYTHMKKTHKNCVRCRRFRCATYFSTEIERQEHEYKFHLHGAFNKVVKCNICSALLSSSSNLITHIKSRHKEAIRCNFNIHCHQYFPNESEKDKHVVETHIQGISPKLSSPDSKNSSIESTMQACQASLLVEKQIISPNTTNIIFQCSLCFKGYKHHQAFTYHMSQVHKNALRCNRRQCAKYFLTEVERQQHEEEFHLNAKHKAHCVKCIYCGVLIMKNGGTVGSLTNHIKIQHKEAIKCDYKKNCPNYFHTISEKNEHIFNEHTQGLQLKMTPMKCIYCDKICQSKFLLREHVYKCHNDVRIKCRVYGCDAYFLSKKENEVHFLQVHQNAESLKKWQCPKCSYKNNNKNTVQNHLKIVHFHKAIMKSTFKCPQCSNSFRSKLNLKSHLQSVHSERCTCQYCGKTMRKVSMIRHYSGGFCNLIPI